MTQKILIIALTLVVLFSGCRSKEQTVTQTWDPSQVEEVSQIRQLESTARLIEAGKQRMLGNYAEALLLYAEAAKADPRNSAALYYLAKLHAQQGYMQDAQEFARRAVALDPDNKYFNMVLADIYFIQNKNEEGLKVQESLASRFPTDLNIQVSILSTLLYLERYEKAIQVFEHIESISGFNNELSLQKQQVFMEMGRVDLALEEAKKLVSYFPGELAYLELLASLYEENDQPEKTYEIYNQMLELHPNNPMALLLLSDYYRSTGETEKSFSKLREAFKSPELGVDGKSRIMVSYYFLSDEDPSYLEQALELCSILTEVHPEDAQAQAIHGDFLFREGNYEEAWEHYHKAAIADPTELAYWQQLLNVEARLQDYESMLKTSEKALEYFFEQPLLYFFNGLAHYFLKNFNEAVSAFRMGEEYSFGDDELQGQFFTLLGDTYYKLNEYERSFRYYQRAIDLNPDDAYALNNYSYYLSVRGTDLDRALRMSARSLELDPDNASFQDTYGWIKYKMGDFAEARKWIRKAIDNSEEPNAVVLEHYGDVLYQLGEKDQALVYWKRALELDKEGDDVEGVSEFLEDKVREGRLIE